MQQARWYFNPCLFHRLIYLSGWTYSGAKVMEVFNPEQDTMLAVQIPLPDNKNCCVYVDNELLVLHAASFIVKFEMGQDGQLKQHSQTTVSVGNKIQNSQPVIDPAHRVFFFIQSGKCFQVNMDTGVQISSI